MSTRITEIGEIIESNRTMELLLPASLLGIHKNPLPKRKGGLLLTQALMEKCIVRASNRKGLTALSVCVGGGRGGADLEVDPAHEMDSANR